MIAISPNTKIFNHLYRPPMHSGKKSGRNDARPSQSSACTRRCWPATAPPWRSTWWRWFGVWKADNSECIDLIDITVSHYWLITFYVSHPKSSWSIFFMVTVSVASAIFSSNATSHFYITWGCQNRRNKKFPPPKKNSSKCWRTNWKKLKYVWNYPGWDHLHAGHPRTGKGQEKGTRYRTRTKINQNPITDRKWKPNSWGCTQTI